MHLLVATERVELIRHVTQLFFREIGVRIGGVYQVLNVISDTLRPVLRLLGQIARSRGQVALGYALLRAATLERSRLIDIAREATALILWQIADGALQAIAVGCLVSGADPV